VIVPDSSAWIGHLRGADSAVVRKLRDCFGKRPLLLGDMILLEVLQGARDENHAGTLEQELRKFPIASMLDTATAIQAARNYRLLRARGITVRKTVDMIIATFCILHGHTLLHDDRDFGPMVEHLGLAIL
jgi:predicted nucleic acid-binding protein